MKYISIDICIDVQNDIKIKDFNKYSLSEYKEQALEIKEIRKDSVNYNNKKLIVIQSNYTNIYTAIYQFPEEIIISKSDPIQELVCKIKKKEKIEDVELLKSHFQEQINNFEKIKNPSDNTKK